MFYACKLWPTSRKAMHIKQQEKKSMHLMSPELKLRLFVNEMSANAATFRERAKTQILRLVVYRSTDLCIVAPCEQYNATEY